MRANAAYMTWKGFSRFVNVWRTTADNVVVVTTNSALNEGSVDAFFSRRISARRNSTINEVRFNLVEERILKELLLVAMPLRGRADSVGRVVRTKRTRQVLRRQHLDVICNRKHHGLRMKMILGSHAMATCGEAQACVLNALDLGER